MKNIQIRSVPLVGRDTINTADPLTIARRVVHATIWAQNLLGPGTPFCCVAEEPTMLTLFNAEKVIVSIP